MGVDFTVYVGPFVKTKRNADMKKWDVVEAINEDLHCAAESMGESSADYICWMPNKSDHGKSLSRHGGDDQNGVAIQQNPQVELDSFREFYADAIGKMLRLYGKRNVSVEWGIVPYYS